MVSRRLMAAVAVQVAAAAALITPARASLDEPFEDCTSEYEGIRGCSQYPDEIQWGPDDYTIIMDGWVCEQTFGSNYAWQFEIFWAEDTDQAGIPDAEQTVRDECDAWTNLGFGGGSGLD